MPLGVEAVGNVKATFSSLFHLMPLLLAEDRNVASQAPLHGRFAIHPVDGWWNKWQTKATSTPQLYSVVLPVIHHSTKRAVRHRLTEFLNKY